MAKSRLARRTHTPTVSKARYEKLVHSKRATLTRAKQLGAQRAGSLVGIGACALVGYLEKQGKMPSIGGFEPTLVAGLALGFVVPSLVKGKAGQMAAEAGAALTGVAAYKLGSGSPLRVGEDDDV